MERGTNKKGKIAIMMGILGDATTELRTAGVEKVAAASGPGDRREATCQISAQPGHGPYEQPGSYLGCVGSLLRDEASVFHAAATVVVASLEFGCALGLDEGLSGSTSHAFVCPAPRFELLSGNPVLLSCAKQGVISIMNENTKEQLQPTLIYGCMGLGGEWNRNPITADDEKVATEAVEAALQEGIHHFDHADIYTLGKAEEVFGRVLERNPSLRDRMIIQSKAGIQIGDGPGGSNRYCARKSYLVEQAKTILRRLKIDYLDVFLVHRPDPLMDPNEVTEAFLELKTGGLVKEFGVSNMSLPQLQLIQKYWDEPLVCNQLQLSLGHSLFVDASVMINTKEHPGGGDMLGMKEYAQESGLALQAWGSSDQGKFLNGAHDGLSEADRKTAQLVWDMAQDHSISRTALVLSWLMKIPANIQPVIGSTKPYRIKECAQALTFQLSDQDWYQLWITARGESLP